MRDLLLLLILIALVATFGFWISVAVLVAVFVIGNIYTTYRDTKGEKYSD